MNTVFIGHVWRSLVVTTAGRAGCFCQHLVRRDQGAAKYPIMLRLRNPGIGGERGDQEAERIPK